MSAIPLLLAAAASTLGYDCALETPKALDRAGDKATISPIGFPENAGDWKFRLLLSSSKTGGTEAEIVWARNPIQLAGKYPVLETGKGAIAFVAVSGGPCMFTETSCASVVQLVEQPDGAAQIIITPTALTVDVKTGIRTPFFVLAEGHCQRSEGSK